MAKPPKKAPTAAPPNSAAPAPASRSRASLIVGVVAMLALAAGAVVYIQGSRTEPPVAAESAAPSAPAVETSSSPPSPVPSPEVPPRPHAQKAYPPLNLPGYALGRSTEVITAAYRFAAEHPEILTYVPCFCGCERMGHHGNEDCFVKARAANGDVRAWEDHGMECNVCLDVAQQAMQMYTSGASVRDIRAAVEAKWTPRLHNHTPTPDPPK